MEKRERRRLRLETVVLGHMYIYNNPGGKINSESEKVYKAFRLMHINNTHRLSILIYRLIYHEIVVTLYL